MGQSLLTDHERPRLGDEVYRHPLIPQMIGMDPSDNLPRPVSTVSLEDSKAPPLEPETMVCMGDESVFVVRDQWGAIVVLFDPSAVRRLHNYAGCGAWLVPVASVSEDQGELLVGSGIYSRSSSGGPLANDYGTQVDHVVVEPLRIQCGHYRRVMTDFQGAVDGDNKLAKQVERVCAAQRGESGEYVSLNNTRVYACEHRSPRDFVSEERLRKFDADAVSAAKKTTEEWNLEDAEASWKTEGEPKE